MSENISNKKNRTILGVWLALLLTTVNAQAHPDEIPANKLAPGKPETTLCGITLDKTDIKKDLSDIATRLGNPIKVESLWEGEGDEYHFQKNALKVYIRTRPEGLYYVEIEGADLDGICKTGAGIKMGDTAAQVQKIYKKFFKKQTSTAKRTAIAVGWKNSETTLTMTLNAKGYIDYIRLDYSIE